MDTFPEVFHDKVNHPNRQAREKIGREVAAGQARNLQDNPIKGHYDLVHLGEIHRHLFRDVSTLSGVVRQYGMSKGHSAFADPIMILEINEKELPPLMDKLKQSVNQPKEYKKTLGNYYAALNEMHPFREGNGRATRIMMHQLAREHGYEFNTENISKEEWNDAAIDSTYARQFNKPDMMNSTRLVFNKIVEPTAERRVAIAKETLITASKITDKAERDLIMRVAAAHGVTQEDVLKARAQLKIQADQSRKSNNIER